MNGIAANMLLHLTSSVRFEGALNVDLNEITTNLVPFPRLHFLLASLSPLAAPRDIGKMTGAPRAVDQVDTFCYLLKGLFNELAQRTAANKRSTRMLNAVATWF